MRMDGVAVVKTAGQSVVRRSGVVVFGKAGGMVCTNASAKPLD
jgi:hypothetical protein